MRCVFPVLFWQQTDLQRVAQVNDKERENWIGPCAHQAKCDADVLRLAPAGTILVTDSISRG